MKMLEHAVVVVRDIFPTGNKTKDGEDAFAGKGRIVGWVDEKKNEREKVEVYLSATTSAKVKNLHFGRSQVVMEVIPNDRIEHSKETPYVAVRVIFNHPGSVVEYALSPSAKIESMAVQVEYLVGKVNASSDQELKKAVTDFIVAGRGDDSKSVQAAKSALGRVRAHARAIESEKLEKRREEEQEKEARKRLDQTLKVLEGLVTS